MTVDDGCGLWTATTGAGDGVLLCHGGPGMWDYLGLVAEMLDENFTVHRWDQRGSGRSERRGPFTVERFVDDIEALRRHFGHERWIVGGHSWGAALGLQYALRYPQRTRALIYVSGTGTGRAWREAYRRNREQRLLGADLLDRWSTLLLATRNEDEDREYCLLTWMTDFIDPVQGRRHAEHLLEDGFLPSFDVNRALSAELANMDEQHVLARCATLSLPALVVHGADDPRPASAVDSLVAALPDAGLAIIPHAGHLPWLEQPEAMRAVVREFCLGLPA